jgi:hypothetical protein
MSRYTCFKQCGFGGDKLSDIYAHYKAEPTHHRLYGKDITDAEIVLRRKAARDRKRAERAAKANGHVIGKEIGFHKHLSVVGAKGRKSNMAILKAQLQNAINESVAKIEKLKFAQQLLESGRLEA